MEEEKQYWTVDELESLSETVQEAEIEYQGKMIKVSWCELTESEEPKALIVGDPVEKATPATTDLKVLSVVLNQICPSAPVSDKFVLTDLIALPRIFLYVLIINSY